MWHQGIPTLTIIDSMTVSIIITNGHNKLVEDPAGATLTSGSWIPYPFNVINALPGYLNKKRYIVGARQRSVYGCGHQGYGRRLV